MPTSRSMGGVVQKEEYPQEYEHIVTNAPIMDRDPEDGDFVEGGEVKDIDIKMSEAPKDKVIPGTIAFNQYLTTFCITRHRSPATSSTRTTNGNRDTATTPPCPTTSLPRTPGGLSPPPPASPYHGRTTYMLSRSRTRSTTYSVASARKKTKQPARGQGTAESQGGCGDVWQAHAGLRLGSLEISARRRARRLLKWEESNCRICYVCLLWWLLEFADGRVD
ncbi:hypothetical protein MCOR24_008421 [Pyricularia oryzae]|nr:hypothetical protein MCOR24_008421 [Pyricularia oryzae]